MSWYGRLAGSGIGTPPAPVNNVALGLNLNQPTYFSPEQPFLNIILNNAISAGYTARGSGGDGWLTSSYGPYTGTVDSGGWPTEIQDGIQNQLLVLRNLPQSNGGTGPRYRSGTYYVLYNGTGSVTYSFDAVLNSHASGSAYGFDWLDTLTVATPSTGGIQINVVSTAAAPNNIRQMALVHSADIASWSGGEVFSPAFIARVQMFGPIRTMDWRSTNVVTWIKNWSDEPDASLNGGYSDCVPWSVIIRLCNEAQVPLLWVNIPMNATPAYVTSLMSALATLLSSFVYIIVQFANETWNGVTVVPANCLANGQALWSNWASFGATATIASYEGYMLQLACNAAVSAFGAANVGPGQRVQIVAGAQYTNQGILDDVMTTPVLTANGGVQLFGNFPIAGACVGWYFNICSGAVPASWLVKTSAQFASDCDTSFNSGGLVPNTTSGLSQYTHVVDVVTNQMSVIFDGLPIFGYEGGSGITPAGEFNQLFDNVISTVISPNTSYSTGTYALNNNNVYIAVIGGTTPATAPPTFNNSVGATTGYGGSWMRVQSAAGPWAAGWTPLFGDVIEDLNGNFQVAIAVTGATGASAPTWGTVPLSTTAAGSQTTDGGVTWLCIRDDSWTTLENYFTHQPAIGTEYTTCMNYWKGKGAACRYFFQFNDCFPSSKFGLWGATDSFLDTTNPPSAGPPKWNAIATWAAANLKWW